MKQNCFASAALVLMLFLSLSLNAQELENYPLIWERSQIEIGSILEEYGEVTSEFYVLNNGPKPVVIQEVVTDCGCTTADFTKDTLYQDKIGRVKIAYDPRGTGGRFKKEIIVKNNLNPEGDTLYLEGYEIPHPTNVASYYNSRVGDLGFRFNSINMGEVFTNKPKIKYVDFYNFKDMPITLDEQRNHLPEHLKVDMIPAIVPAKSRGLLAIQYDGAIKNDLGFFDEIVPFHIEANGDQEIELRLLTTVHEYFAPVPKSEVDNIPKLAISEVEVDLNNISSKKVISRSIKLTNIGHKPVNIRKIVTNCDCVDYNLKTRNLLPGEETNLLITFDPKGRLGIDHKTVAIFSNDPLNPTRTIVIKSRID